MKPKFVLTSPRYKKNSASQVLTALAKYPYSPWTQNAILENVEVRMLLLPYYLCNRFDLSQEKEDVFSQSGCFPQEMYVMGPSA